MKTFLLALVAASAVSASAQIVNPGFETGDFTGWTITGDAEVFTGAQYIVSGLEPLGGNYYAALHADSTIWQSGLNLLAGQTVTLWMEGLETSANSSFLLLKKGGDPTISVAWHPFFEPDSMFPDKYSAISYTITESGIYSVGAENLGPVEPSQLGGGVLGVDDLTVTGRGTGIGAVPEPSTYGLAAAATLLGLATLRRRTRKIVSPVHG